jgi:hypothetical protein
VFVPVLTCLIPLAAFAAEEDAIMQKAIRIITQHRLLSWAELACSSLMLDEATKTAATIIVRGKHGGKCGGAPEKARVGSPWKSALRPGKLYGIGATRWR